MLTQCKRSERWDIRKKNMKKIIIAIIITTSLATANAQMYNFLGNHVILNMEGYFSPAWINPNPVSSGWDVDDAVKRYLGLNYFLTPNIELMVWKKGTVGVGYNYYNSPFKGTDIRAVINNSYWNEGYGNVTAHGFNVFYKQYIGDRFAPLGHYLKFIFDGFFYQYKMDVSPSQVHPNGVPYSEIPAILENKGSLFGLKVEYGYDFIVLNRLKLTLGAGIGTTFGGYKVMAAKIKDKMSYYSEPLELHFDDYARARILGAYWAGVKLGIGFIAF